MLLSKDLREFIKCLNSNGVDYLVVGALAVSWHGFPRYSADIDLFLRASPQNADRILTALREFGFGNLSLTVNDLLTPAQVIQLGYEPNRIDLLTSISGVDFEDAWQSRVGGHLDGIPVHFIGLDALLRNKEASGRGKDRIDAEELRKAQRPTDPS